MSFIGNTHPASAASTLPPSFDRPPVLPDPE
jgi:hypothetical protein